MMSKNRCYGCMTPKTAPGKCPHCGYDGSAPNASHQLPAGTLLKEQYLVGKVLGQGGFGITYLGWDMYLDIPVAIKEYFPGGVVSRDSTVSLEVTSYTGATGARFQNNKERFMREAKTMARFSEIPQIVQIKNFFLSNNTAYIVMEYVQGITLKNYIKRQGGKLPPEQALEILHPVMEALCKVHKAGLVHRDISPDNIMMQPNGQVKLLDFGAVRDVGIDVAVDQELNRSTEAILKQGYAPIEQYQSRGSLGPWTDVYAMCATLYFCVTGQIPPDAPERLLGEEELPLAKLAPDLPERLTQVLRTGMELRAENRYLSMDALCAALFGEKPPVSIHTVVPPQPSVPTPKTTTVTVPAEPTVVTAPPKKKKRWPILVATVGLAAALTIGGVALLGGDKEKNSDSDTELKSSVSISGNTNPTEGQTVTGECGEELDWSLNTATGELTISGFGRMWDYERTGNCPWEEYREDIRSVTFGDDVLNAGTYAFYGCTELTQVRFGKAFEHIGINSFARTALEEVDIPDTVRGIGADAFAYCEGLRRVSLPTNLHQLESRSFLVCFNLEYLRIGPNTAIEIDEENLETPFSAPGASCHPEKLVIHCVRGSDADEFAQFSGFEYSYYDPSGTDSTQTSNQPEAPVLTGAFGEYVNYSLNTATGELVLSGTGSTWDYTSQHLPWEDYSRYIRTVTVGDGITRIGHYAFAGSAVETVTIGNNVTSIGEGAFFECLSLKDITFSNSLNSIGIASFMSSGLERVTLPDSLQIIGESAFMETPVSQITFGTGLLRIDKYAFSSCKLTSVTLPDSLAAIGESSFQNCPLTSVSFGKALNRIDKGAFANCNIETLYLPDNLKTIEDMAFAKCTALRMVRFGTALTSIGTGAFMYTAIESADLPQNLSSLGIGSFAFCDQLSRVALPDKLTALEQATFRDCPSLRSVTIGANTDIAGNPFIPEGNSLPNMEVLFVAKSGGSPSLRAFAKQYESYGISIVEG